MSGDGVGPGRPPAAGRFRKGQSGNPKGRPKASPKPAASAFDVMIDRTLTVTQNGRRRELTAEEALQHKTYQTAIGGNRAAQREVLKMIAEREKWLAARPPKHQPIEQLIEPDPDNADEALVLLGIAEPDPRWSYPRSTRQSLRLQLRPWAVQAALSRPGRRCLSPPDISDDNRRMREAEALRWPKGEGDEHGD